MPGVWTWNFGDDFAHLYLDSIATNHNAIGRGYETFGNGTAETLVPEQPSEGDDRGVVPAAAAAGAEELPWSARDNVNYNETAALAALDHAAQESQQLLRNFYLKGLHSCRADSRSRPTPS